MVPNNNGTNTYNAIISGGSLTQDISPGVTIEQLQMSGGTLTLANPLNLNAGLQYSGGTIQNGVLNVAGTSNQSAQFSVNNLTINNSGIYNFTADGITLFIGGATFNNSGTLVKTSGSGVDNFNVTLNNTGTVSSLAGTLQISTNGSSGGTFSASSGATVSFGPGTTFTFGDGVHFAGAGSIVISDNTDAHVSGTVNNSGNFVLSAINNLSRLILDSDSVLTGGGTLTLTTNGSGQAQITGGRLLTNVDNLIQGQGNLGANQTQFDNKVSGIVNANVTAAVLYVDPNGNGFHNEGLLEATNGGILQLTGNASGGFGNSGATILASGSNSQVQLIQGVAVTGGTLSTTNSGMITTPAGQTSFLTNLTNSGTYLNADNADTHINGTINNTGAITLSAVNNLSRWILDSDSVLTGGGTLTLTANGSGQAQISGGRLLTNLNNLIQGQGNLGANQTQFDNKSAGVVNANVNAAVLYVDPNGNGFRNEGLLEATNGGILQLTGSAGGGFDNTAATILASGSSSQVQLIQNVSVTGGTLSTSNGGLVTTPAGHISFLSNLTNSGTYLNGDNADTHVNGTINNTGTMTFTAGNNLSRMILDSDTTFNGAGTITLTSNGTGQAQITGGRLLTNVDNLIQGQGNLGANQTQFDNKSGGTINANVSGAVLYVDPNGNGFLNEGLLEATNGGILQLTGNAGGGFNNTGATILASGANSQVQLIQSVSVVGGTLSTNNSGLITTPSGHTSFITNLTNAGTYLNADNADTHINGTISNTGTMTFSAGNNLSRMILDSDSTLTGGGTVTLTTNGSGQAQITGGRFLTNVNNLIQGQGNLGANQTQFDNKSGGVVNANVNGTVLYVDPNGNGFRNEGILEATNGGILQLAGNAGGGFDNTNATILADGSSSQVQLIQSVSLTGGTLSTTNGGLITTPAGHTSFLSNLTNSGNYLNADNADTHVSGTINNTGTMTMSAVNNQSRMILDGDTTFTGGGTVNLTSSASGEAQIIGNRLLTNADNFFNVRGTINNSINNSGTLQPALGGNGLNVIGNITLLGSSRFSFQLGGTIQGSQYSFLNVNGSVNLGGQLIVTLVNGFQPSASNTFTLLTSNSNLAGSFTNVASGGRLAVTGGGTIQVDYTGNAVTLSNYSAPMRASATALETAASPSGDGSGAGRQGPSPVSAKRPSKQVAVLYARHGPTPRSVLHSNGQVIHVSDSSQLANLLENTIPSGKGRAVITDVNPSKHHVVPDGAKLPSDKPSAAGADGGRKASPLR